MTDFLEKNLAALKKRDPKLFSSLKEYFLSNKTDAAAPVPVAGGFHNLRIALDDGTFRDLYPDPPGVEMEKSRKLSKLKYPKLLVFDGIGLGYHFFELLREGSVAPRDVIVVEKRPAVFAAALKLHDFTPYFENEAFTFFAALDPAAMKGALVEYFTYRNRLVHSGRIEHFYFAPALKADGAYYVAFANALKEATRELAATSLAPGEDNYRAFVNLLANRDALDGLPLLHDLRDALKGTPAVLVGAGPSLGPELEPLRRHRDRFFVAAVDAAVKPLLQAGIRPHLVVSAERVASVKNLLGGLPEDFTVPMATLPSQHPAVFQAWRGPKILLKRYLTFGHWLWPDLPEIPMPLGVSPMAYSVLGALGCAPIALLGQDFSFDAKSGASYVPGTDTYADETTRDFAAVAGACEIPGNSGAPVRTTALWRGFLKELERLIGVYRVRCEHVIAPDAGAKIAGAVRVDPAEFWRRAQNLPELDRDAAFRAALADPPNKISPRVDFKTLLARTLAYLDAVGADCLEIMREMSLDYHDDIDVRGASAVWPEHEAWLKKWNAAFDRMADRDLFLYDLFLNLFVGDSYILNMSARENEVPRREAVLSYLFSYSLRTQAFLLDCHAWSARVAALIRESAGTGK